MRSCKQGMARRLTSIISNRRRLRHGAEMAVYGGEIVQEILLEELAGREADFYCDIFQVVEDISAHTHDFLEVAYILEGTLVHSAGGHTCTAREGEYFVIDNGVSHVYRCPLGPAKVFNCLFRPAFLDNTLRSSRGMDDVLQSHWLHVRPGFRFGPYSGAAFTDPEGRVRRNLEIMREEFEKRELGYMAVVRARLLELMVLTMRQLRLEQAETEDGDLAYLKTMAETRFAEPLRLEELAGNLHRDPAHLSRKFRRVCGCGFKEYLQHCRMEEARRLLANTDRLVADVAESVGYRDRKFFNRLFLAQTGTTPSEYRRTRRPNGG